MDIVEFFELSGGKWFSQRTSHHFAFKQSESGKSDLLIEVLLKTDPAVLQLCKQFEIDAALALCGARISCDGTMEWDQEKRTGSTILVPISDPDKPNEGQLLHGTGNAETAPMAGRYIMGRDDALTLIIDHERMYSEERLWFAGPNLRIRTSLLKQADGFSSASFCSEIRMGLSKPQSTSTDMAQAVTENKR